MTLPVQPHTESYLASFSQFEKSLNGESTSDLHALRRAAIHRFAQTGFPTSRDEEWRFTNVAPIAKIPFSPVLRYENHGVDAAHIKKLALGLKCTRLVFVNGHYAPELSVITPSSKGAKVMSLKTALRSEAAVVEKYLAKYVKHEENGFTALSAAFLQDGAFIHVADDVKVKGPIHLVFVAAGERSVAALPRNLIVVGNNSKVSIIESYVSIARTSYLTNAVTEFIVGENAIIEHDKLQDEALDSFHIGTVHFQQSRGSNVVSNAINFGGSIVRNTITAVLNGEGVECTLNGLNLGTGTQVIDSHTVIDHAKPHCASHELYKSVLDGKSKGIFNGKIFVRKDAQKTDAKQTNKTLLLSDDATIDTKPQLEIFADDVKCTHGATVGYLDEEQMFYLRSRGIGVEAARDLLTFAFANDIINRIHIDALRERLDTMIQRRLSHGRTLEGL
jgi:Fe-S cluster assembly protein SufD